MIVKLYAESPPPGATRQSAQHVIFT